MNWPKISLNVGLFLFVVSFMLPAYAVSTKLFYGYQCAYIAPAIAVSGDIEGGILAQILTRLHFFMLGMHNVALLTGLLVTKLKRDEYDNRFLVIWVISTLNTILFYFYNHFMVSMGSEALKLGYFIWVISSIMILIPNMIKKQKV